MPLLTTPSTTTERRQQQNGKRAFQVVFSIFAPQRQTEEQLLRSDSAVSSARRPGRDAAGGIVPIRQQRYRAVGERAGEGRGDKSQDNTPASRMIAFATIDEVGLMRMARCNRRILPDATNPYRWHLNTIMTGFRSAS